MANFQLKQCDDKAVKGKRLLTRTRSIKSFKTSSQISHTKYENTKVK